MVALNPEAQNILLCPERPFSLDGSVNIQVLCRNAEYRYALDCEASDDEEILNQTRNDETECAASNSLFIKEQAAKGLSIQKLSGTTHLREEPVDEALQRITNDFMAKLPADVRAELEEMDDR